MPHPYSHPAVGRLATPQYLRDHAGDAANYMRALHDYDSEAALHQGVDAMHQGANAMGSSVYEAARPALDLLNTGGRLRDGVASAGMAGYEGEYGETLDELGKAVRSLLPRKMLGMPDDYQPVSRDWRKLDKFVDDEGNPNWLSMGADLFTDPEALLSIGMLGKHGVKQLMRKSAR